MLYWAAHLAAHLPNITKFRLPLVAILANTTKDHFHPSASHQDTTIYAMTSLRRTFGRNVELAAFIPFQKFLICFRV